MFFRRKDSPPEPAATSDEQARGLFAGLARTRARLAEKLGGMFGRTRPLDDALVDEIEEALLGTDAGVEVASDIADSLRAAIRKRQVTSPEQALALVRERMRETLAPVQKPLSIAAQDTPFVILLVGVNGVGKTTTLAKLAARLKGEGHSVLVAAADTFRAAAIEQLQEWGRRLDIPVIAQAHGTDPAAVAHDALAAARSRGIDVVLIDTAGRQHTQADLMQQLEKIQRVLRKQDPAAPQEVLLVLDAGTGQNAIVQAERFAASVDLSALALTKLDGTARGGVLLAVARRFRIPVWFLGVGEQAEDLREFDAGCFVDSLLPERLGAETVTEE
jgi:fused signal recognition particle receptor